MQERIFGSECEYAPVRGRLRSAPEFESAPFRPEAGHAGPDWPALMRAAARVCGTAMTGEFLGNGGRLYLDRGGHPEYATPECRSAADLAVYEKAGDRIMLALAAAAGHAEGRACLRLYKNNTDAYGNTYGAHENYLAAPRAMAWIERLIPFLVTRQIYTGAGKLMTQAAHGCTGFQVSQRADFFDRAVSDRTSEVRGIINIRRRDIHQAGCNQRLHLIVGDSNMSPWSIFLKAGLTALVLRLLEEDGLADGPSLDAPAEALKIVSRDLAAPLTVSLGGRGARRTAVEIQSAYLEKALSFFGTRQAGAEETRLLSAWQEVLEGLRRLRVSQAGVALEEDPGGLRARLDWVLKLWLLDRSRGRGADERRLKVIDMSYHDLDPDTGLYERCLALGFAEPMAADETVAAAVRTPPPDTRARLRGWVIERAAACGARVEVENWERLRVLADRADAEAGRHYFTAVRGRADSLRLRLSDPFAAQDPGVVEKLERFLETRAAPG